MIHTIAVDEGIGRHLIGTLTNGLIDIAVVCSKASSEGVTVQLGISIELFFTHELTDTGEELLVRPALLYAIVTLVLTIALLTVLVAKNHLEKLAIVAEQMEVGNGQPPQGNTDSNKDNHKRNGENTVGGGLGRSVRLDT